MYPILWQWGDLAVPSWHVLFAVGAIAAYLALGHMRKLYYEDLDPAKLAGLFIACYVSGYFGARLISIWVEEFHTIGFLATIKALLRFGPMTMYGGFLGGFLGGLIYAAISRLRIPALADMAIPCFMLAVAIGRIGCFLNGDDYGVPVAQDPAPWWAVTFPSHPNPIPRVPVQLVEATFCGLIFIIGYLKVGTLQRRFFVGAPALLLTALYAGGRFFIEYFRDDPRGWFVPDAISTSQGLGLMILLAIVAVFPFIYLRRR